MKHLTLFIVLFTPLRLCAQIGLSPVQQAVGVWSTSATVPVVLTSTPTAGNTEVLEYDANASVVTISSIAQTSSGCTWTLFTGAKVTTNSRTAEIWYCSNVSGSASKTITLTLGSAGGAACCGANVSEWAGIPTSGFVGSANTNTSAASATWDSGTITPTAGFNALIIVSGRVGAALSGSTTGGFTDFTLADTRDVKAYQVVTSTSGSYDATHPVGSTAWSGAIAEFVGNAASSSAVRHRVVNQ